MKNKTSSLLIVGALIGLVALRALVASVPNGMVILFTALFVVLKPLAGLRTWWHAALGAAVSSLLWLGYGSSNIALFGDGWRAGMASLMLAPALAVLAFVSVTKVMLFERARRASEGL